MFSLSTVVDPIDRWRLRDEKSSHNKGYKPLYWPCGGEWSCQSYSFQQLILIIVTIIFIIIVAGVMVIESTSKILQS